RWVCDLGAATVNLIRPKPARGNDRWYAHNVLSKEDARLLADLLPTLEPLFARTALTVDCAFSFLFHGRPADELNGLGVAGCAMGARRPVTDIATATARDCCTMKGIILS